jgi:hypothetical protein
VSAVIAQASATVQVGDEPTPPQVVRTNLATNGSLETGTAGWSTYIGGTMSRVNEWAASGSWSRKCVKTATTMQGHIYLQAAAAAGITPGKRVTVGVTVRAVSALTVVVAARATFSGTPATGEGLGYAGAGGFRSVALAAGEVRRVVLGFVVPALQATQTALTNLGLQVTNNGGAVGATFYADAVSIELGETDGAYFDGSTPQTPTRRYAWTGPVFASSSTASTWPDYSALSTAPSSADLTLDETRAPFGALTATVPRSSVPAAGDPLSAPPTRAWFTHDVRYSGSITLGDLSRQLDAAAITTLSAWSAAITASGAASLQDLSERYGTDWGAGVLPTVRRRVAMFLRRVETARAADQATITACTGEALLTDYALVRKSALYSGPTLRDMVRLALGSAVPGAVPMFHGDVARNVVAADARRWEPGRTAWDWISAPLAAAGVRLWVGTDGVWNVGPVSGITSPVELLMQTDRTVTDVRDTIDRDADGYADAVVVTYDWTDDANIRHVSYDVAGSGTKVLSVRIQGAPNGPGEAGQRLVAAQRRARSMALPALPDPAAADALPGGTVRLLTAEDGTLVGRPSALAYSYPADTMTVTAREMETP